MESSSEKLSPFNLMTAILKGAKFDGSNSSESGEVVPPAVIAMLLENKELMMILMTSVAVLIGCVVVLVWWRSSGLAKRAVEPPKLLVPKAFVEPEKVYDGKKKVTIFLGWMEVRESPAGWRRKLERELSQENELPLGVHFPRFLNEIAVDRENRFL